MLRMGAMAAAVVVCLAYPNSHRHPDSGEEPQWKPGRHRRRSKPARPGFLLCCSRAVIDRSVLVWQGPENWERRELVVVEETLSAPKEVAARQLGLASSRHGASSNIAR